MFRQFSSKVPSKGFFIITGSNLIRAGENYRVTVFCNGYKSEEKLSLRLRSYDDLKDPDYKKIYLNGNEVLEVEFETKHLVDGEYYLEVKNGEKRTIVVNPKKQSIFVQTDKSIYKPSDTIQFRVVVLDAETRPLNPKRVELFITDGAENRVKQFEQVSFKNGVYQNELQLSDLPVMGSWKIHVKIGTGEDFVKIFEVNEYVLPKFEVSIETNPDIHCKYGKLKATVRAKYTFGKAATGSAIVTAHVERQTKLGRNTDSPIHRVVTKQIAVDGKNFVEFDMEKDLGITNSNCARVVVLEAKFKELLSEKECSAKAEVKVHKYPHKLELKKSNEKFKPGLPYSITAIVKNYDKGTPVTDSFNPVKFNLTFHYEVLTKYKESFEAHVNGRKIRPNEEYEAWEEFKEHKEYEILPENGIAKLELDLEKKYTFFEIKAKYQETEESINKIMKVETECDQYIMARVITDNPTLSKIVQVEVLSTDEISQLSYEVLGRGDCVEAKTVYFPPTKRHVINIKPSLMMIPKAQLVLNYLTDDGEIISERIEINFGNELINHMKIELSSNQVKPGSEIDITVSTLPNSFVNLLGVDQSVLLLKKGNDIEASTVFSDLLKYGKEKNYSNFHGGYLDFREANAIIITNAKKPFERKYFRRAYRNVYCDMMASSISKKRSLSSRFLSSRSYSDDDELCLRNFTRRPDARKEPVEDEFQVEENIIDLPRKDIEIRKEFPETWLFDSLEFLNDTSVMKISKKVPDTITSWVITGFSIDPLTGLGLTKQPSKFNVFQPFFVSTNLPYSIKRGEVVSIPIIVFNYMDHDQMSDIKLFNEEGEFEFIENESGFGEVRSVEKSKSKSAFIKSNEGATISFTIRPLKVGNIKIKVIAESTLAGDGVERQLRVEPEGVPQYFNEAIFVDLRQNRDFNKIFDIEIPENAVSDSTHIEVSAIGDILGPSIENLDKLIKLPYGCGEQNMLNFVPNIVVLQYLTSVNKLTPAIEAKTKKYLESGYQRELTYKHDDGSYSAFGKYDKLGSTWLTAFVAKSFHEASKYIRIEQSVIKQALNFLSKVQSIDGSFKEYGKIFQKDMQGGASKGIALTAYTLVTFIENEKYRDKYKDTIKQAIDYIVANKDQLDDLYSLAVATYAFYLANHELKDSFMKKLESRAINVNSMKYWTKPIPSSEKSNPWYNRPLSVNVEMSAYALQAFVQANRSVDAISIMKWLITQRNENGGFQSTQDTVVGLQSLAKLASKIYNSDSNVEISVESKNSQESLITVNNANALVLQKYELSSDDRTFEVNAKGKGFCIFQISYHYNLDDAGKYPRFNLNPVVQKSSNKEFLNLTVTTNFVPDSHADKSNMAVMEVTLPSGFTFDSDHLPALLRSERVKKVETKNNDTVVVVYFDDVDKKELRPQIKAYRTHKVAKQKPAPVVIYDYYDNSRRATTFYSPPEISISDICVG